ncbi:hypothetical protein [Methylovulum psychrotolerans]|uniref:Uncharacterized protein n=1 Tax=Methylovulum psychrotolerans TaxID=1704499 RepID=A0A2S5CR74_9GAMM|nr:hypothetical protein [Methylovulum psychrotolerans]POZ53304.1 hypothetical protein AADEFJLK_00323 [Methylovulum psychrotolerans]
MPAYQKLEILGFEEDTQTVYKDGRATNEVKPRLRAIVRPVKPDTMTINVTELGDDIINKFRAIVGRVALIPGRAGATDSGTLFITPEKGITADDIELLAMPKPPAPPVSGAVGGATQK